MENSFCRTILFWLVFINPETTNSKEVVVKSGNMKKWFSKSLEIESGKDGEMWSDPSTTGYNYTKTCGMDTYFFTNHIDLRRAFAAVMYMNVKAELNLKRNFSSFQIYVYRGSKKPDIPSKKMLKDVLGSKYGFASVFNITSTAVPVGGLTQTFSLNMNGTKGVTFGIKSSGECGKIFEMILYYYYCEAKFINGVKFESTMSPFNGSKEVTGNCANDSSTLPSSADVNLTRFKGFCHSNGTWQVDEKVKCSCNKGFEPCESRGCCACRDKYFKSNSSNENCTQCPLNSVHSRNKTSCKCNEGYHRRPNDRKCYRNLSKLKVKLECHDIGKDRAVNLTWNDPKRGSIDESLETRYDVTCSSCVVERCNRSCSQVKYEPSPTENMSQMFVKISNLKPGTRYVFKVYAKNSLNHDVQFGREKLIEFDCDVSKSTAGKRDDMDVVVFVIIGVASILLFNAIIILIIVLIRRRSFHQNRGVLLANHARQVEINVGHSVYIDPAIYECPEDALAEFVCELDPSLIFLETSIGGGEFGDVYKGHITCADGKKIVVAVKTLKDDATEKSAKDFMLEASIMGQFDDPNVVRLEGVVMKSLPRMIVIEFMSNGSLDHFLEHKKGKLTQLQLMGMARDVASGMKYLTGMNFIHRDLAARNILVGKELLCKISDFGLARVLNNQESSPGEYSTSGGKIPIRWTAPEAIKYRTFSSGSDVWSYGILLWELMTYGERPYCDWDNFQVMREIENGYRLPAPKKCPRAVHELMLQCWNESRGERPTFERITLLISGWIRSPDAMQDELKCSMVLTEWLQSIKMGNYVSHFIGAGFENPYQLSCLSDEDLRELGITLIGHRNKILKGVRALVYEKNGKVETPTPIEV